MICTLQYFIEYMCWLLQWKSLSLSRNYPPFAEPKKLLAHSQERKLRPCSEPDESSRHTQIFLVTITLLLILNSHLCVGLTSGTPPHLSSALYSSVELCASTHAQYSLSCYMSISWRPHWFDNPDKILHSFNRASLYIQVRKTKKCTLFLINLFQSDSPLHVPSGPGSQSV